MGLECQAEGPAWTSVGNRFTEGFEMQCVGCMGGLAGVGGGMCSL